MSHIQCLSLCRAGRATAKASYSRVPTSGRSNHGGVGRLQSPEVSSGHELNGSVDVPVERVGLALEWLVGRAGLEYPRRTRRGAE